MRSEIRDPLLRWALLLALAVSCGDAEEAAVTATDVTTTAETGFVFAEDVGVDSATPGPSEDVDFDDVALADIPANDGEGEPDVPVIDDTPGADPGPDPGPAGEEVDFVPPDVQVVPDAPDPDIASSECQTNCDDGLDCTDDSCSAAAVCVHQLVVDRCLIDGVCYEPGALNGDCRVCLPGADTADWSPLTGGVCDDLNPCTTDSTCSGGACLPGVPKACEAPSPCHESLGCDPKSGDCLIVEKPEGAACGPGQVCSIAECLVGDAMPAGSIAWFDASVCPGGWQLHGAAVGRTLVPSDATKLGESAEPPFLSGEDRIHSHPLSGSALVPGTSYVGIAGCCNGGPSAAGDVTLGISMETASTGLPYVQLLPCEKVSAEVLGTRPTGVLVFQAGATCPDDLTLTTTDLDRLPVGVPAGGTAASSFGGGSLDAPAHSHDVVGTLALGSHGIALASGCCAGGYAKAGSAPFSLGSGGTSLSWPSARRVQCEVPAAPAVPPLLATDAAPPGIVLFAVGDVCPAGWVEHEPSRGRLIVGASLAGDVGVTVGTPLADKEDRAHTHSVTVTAILPGKSVAGADGPNQSGAGHGPWTSTVDSSAVPTGLGFIQRLACVKP